MGNLKVERDWGFAPDYVGGMCRILRQISVRARETGVKESDEGVNYRDMFWPPVRRMPFGS